MRHLLTISLLLSLTACVGVTPSAPQATTPPASIAPLTVHPPKISQRLADYATVRLSADLSGLDADQKKMLALLIEAADVTNALYWRQNWGDRDALLARIDDPQQRALDRKSTRLNSSH